MRPPANILKIYSVFARSHVLVQGLSPFIP
jgi:hypothetical protein